METIWKSGSDELVHSRYGRNRVGGVEWRLDVKAHSLTPEVKTQDNYYRYDGLQQVTRHDRGELVPSSGPGYTGIDPDTRQQQELFTFDETGNWMTDYNAASSLSQSRTQNAANEISALTQDPTAIQPTYDPAGNMRTVPQPSDWEQGYNFKWDAWNRLVEIKDGETVIASYAYDALTRRIITTTGSIQRHYYYDNQWRALEERVTIDSTTTIDRRYVWSPFNRWNLISRMPAASGSLDVTHYVLKDYLDPVALVKIVDSAAVVDERYSYDAFGSVNIMDEDFEPRTSSVCDWNFLFHAEFKDLDTGLYNYGHRYYHTNLGRWLSRDPIGEKGGLNLFGFVHNSPTNLADNLGLSFVDCISCVAEYVAFNASLAAAVLAVAGALTCTGSVVVTVGADTPIALPCALVLAGTALAAGYGAIKAFEAFKVDCNCCFGSQSDIEKAKSEIENLKSQMDELERKVIQSRKEELQRQVDDLINGK